MNKPIKTNTLNLTTHLE
ncbi:hypothetical protein EEL31_00895 [Brevibacillus laterosporus]|uniref:Uncharacterized protein n=1 Tax=Brevibacillus laterosporus TaxID=1465 RepID=A0A518VFJ1_BRELA|nr:hypothetical protein EEL30_13565 [Brevibacillus laterosporus]TPG73496.1 hypothetical protein EEL31_00895 [Brevibacillus laterosporus]